MYHSRKPRDDTTWSMQQTRQNILKYSCVGETLENHGKHKTGIFIGLEPIMSREMESCSNDKLHLVTSDSVVDVQQIAL